MAWQITLEVSDARWRQALPDLALLIRAALHAVPAALMTVDRQQVLAKPIRQVDEQDAGR